MKVDDLSLWRILAYSGGQVDPTDTNRQVTESPLRPVSISHHVNVFSRSVPSVDSAAPRVVLCCVVLCCVALPRDNPPEILPLMLLFSVLSVKYHTYQF